MDDGMSVKQILFNTDMVRAILDGRKTMTRRVVKFLENRNPHWSGYIPDGAVLYGSNNIPAAKSPYRPGDVLWVRETWARMMNGDYWYKADGKDETDIGLKIKWRPSIHMPREAARIWLRVTGVRVERLQDVTDREAEKEGIGDLFYEKIGFGNKDYGCMTYSDSKGVIGFQKEQFAHLWDSTITPADRERYGWVSNSWVWVIAFERCEKPEEG